MRFGKFTDRDKKQYLREESSEERIDHHSNKKPLQRDYITLKNKTNKNKP